MKILFLTENFPPEVNASAGRVYERACYWVKWGHDVTVITCEPNFPDGKVFPGYRNRWYFVERMDGIRVVRVKTYISANKGVVRRTSDFISFMLTGTAAGLFQERPDVVIATSPQFFAAVAGWLIAFCRRRPFVFELSDLWPASITAVGAMRENFGLNAIRALELFLYRRSAAIVALTDAFKKDLVNRGIYSAKIRVVINGVDLPRYSPRQKSERLLRELGLSGKFVVGYVGTLGMAHALEKVLDGAELLKGDDRIRFLFVGSGASKDDLVSMSSRRSINNVLFVDRQPKEKIPEFLSILDVSLIHLKDTPVFATVIPSKLFEAMGMGLPILLAGPPDGEGKRIVDTEGAGVCIRSEAPDLLADTVRRLKDDPHLLRSFAAASAQAAKNYTRERQAREVLDVIKGASGL
jgi:colanic acid biosynthesis glycosyl transferase WcaI